MSDTRPKLPLLQYFLLEGVNAFNGTIFLYCIFFWTSRRFGYSASDNLFLTATHGLTYIVATRFGGRLSDRLGYDRMLSFCFLGMAATLLLGWIPSWWGTPFVVMMAYSFFIGPTWPTLEAVVLHCPGKTSVPNRLGFYNISWALGDAVGFACGALLFPWHPDSVLWVPGILHAVKWVWLTFGPRDRSVGGTTAMEMPHRGDDVPRPTKRRFMLTAWVANSLGYLMIAGLQTLSPQIGEGLGISDAGMILLGTAPLFARTASFVLWWKWEGWHYRMAWTQWALWLTPVALGLAFFSHSLVVVGMALFFFGALHGLTYSGSLYYSMDYGENKGDFGGLHEGIIGIGILVGSLLAAFAAVQAGPAGGVTGAKLTILLLPVLVGIVTLRWAWEKR